MAVRPDSVTIYMNSIELLLIVNAKFRALPIERLSSRPLIERLTVVESYGESRFLKSDRSELGLQCIYLPSN